MRKWINLFENTENFNEVLARANSYGALIMAEHWGDKIFIEYVERGPQDGSGKKAIGDILKFADENGLVTVLSVLHSDPKLIRYWHRYGFRVNGIADQEFDAWLREFEATWDIDTVEDEIDMTRLPH